MPSVPNSLATTRYLTGIDTTPRPGSPVLGPFVLVLVAPTIPEGLLAKGLLEAEGIPVMTRGEAEGPYRMGPMELWVPAELEPQARMILEEALAEGAGMDAARQTDEAEAEPD
jgi:Putative prokaryotic signal transducing protein